MASLTQWTWVWASSGRWWRTGKPGVLQFMELQRVGHNLATEKQWWDFRCCIYLFLICAYLFSHHSTFSSVQFGRSVVSNSLWHHALHHTRLPCPSPTPRAWSNSCPLSQWCYPTISSSVIPFSFCLQSFPASGCFPMSQFFTSGSQSIGVSASISVLPMNIQDWFPLGWTGWISLQSQELSRVFSNTTLQKHQLSS